MTNFGMKDSLTLPSLGKEFFIRLRDENDGPVFICTDSFMRNFVRISIKGVEKMLSISIISFKLVVRF